MKRYVLGEVLGMVISVYDILTDNNDNEREVHGRITELWQRGQKWR